MLPPKHRLPLRKELFRVKREGRLVPGRFFGLLYVCQEQKPAVSRFGIICSRKIAKKAVDRNHIRRLLGEAVQTVLPQVKPGFDAIFLVKKNIVHQDLVSLKKAVIEVFKKAGLFS